MAKNQHQNQAQNPLPLSQPIQPDPSRAVANHGEVSVRDFVNPVPAPIQPPIIYSPFGQANFHIRPNVINLFQNHQCDVISHKGMSRDAFRMCPFPHTLKEGAKIWMMSQPPGSIVSWNDMIQKFTMKFFSPTRVHQIRNEIHTFKQKELESYPETWEMYKNLLRKCPNLEIPKQVQMYIFYYEIRQEFKNMVDASAGGSIMAINVDDAYELYERIAENQSMWPSDKEVSRKTTGIYNVDAVIALTAQMEAITRKLDSLTHSVNMVQTPTPKCASCGVDHITANCSLASTHIGQPANVSYAQNYQRQNGPYTYNYHPSLNKHPNYAWVDNSDQVNQMRGNPLAIQQKEEKRQSLEETVIQNQQASIHNLEKQVGQIAIALANRAQGTLLSDTKKNPKEQVLAVEVVNYATIETPLIKPATPVQTYVLPIPFPQRLQRQPKNEQAQAITTRSRVQLPEITVKKKGTEENRIPTSGKEQVGQKLGLGDPKAASIILQLADQSLKHPYEIVEDILIKGGGKASQMLIILRRPFLSTSRALLDFDANEIVLRVEDKQQSFTMENSIKQPSYFEDCQRVDHWVSYKGRPNEGEIVGRDTNENLIVWRVKDERRKCNHIGLDEVKQCVKMKKYCSGGDGCSEMARENGEMIEDNTTSFFPSTHY
ncbi:uncharacterized protein LOC111380654 [Olea europaea var. sylvestris]|uniref:uncharacterized protein LOC111380654 n=1 Tax=Olea europaea var. sylvestris TaxID=158386 RepID=UPI000C1D09AA|nr:uncharacterized protein LOC111380654 [Olea europaea var. sylvestris]